VKTIDLRLKWTRIDLEQEVATLDDGAFGESHGGHVTGDARPDGDRVDRLQAAGEFIPLGDLARDDVRDRHLWWWRWSLLRLRVRAADRERNEGE
jgi:hypothetical protein